MALLDPETVERLRYAAPEDAYREIKDAVYRSGGSSEEFLEAFTELVEAGVISWEQIEEIESAETAAVSRRGMS